MVDVFSNPYDELPLRNDKYAGLCTELHMGHKGITRLRGFEKFATLNLLFLNDNKLTSLEGLEENFRIKQLYLHNNKFRIIERGSLQHFVFLNKLTLNGNYLDDLDGTIEELRGLRHLKVLDLFDNPIAQEDNYRRRVICEVSTSVEVLDRHKITDEERVEARKFKIRMQRLQQLGKTKKALVLPPTEEEEQEMRIKNARLRDVMKRITSALKAHRPFLEPAWLPYDKRNLGFVKDSVFWEILRQYGIEQLLLPAERDLLTEQYTGLAEVPGISVTGTLPKVLVNYRKFCMDIVPSDLRTYADQWHMDPAPEISVTAKDLNKYVTAVTLRTQELEELLRREKLIGSRTLLDASSGQSGQERMSIRNVCEEHGLDPWVAGELSKFIEDEEGSEDNAQLSLKQVGNIFRKMMRLNRAPEGGVKRAIDKLCALANVTPPPTQGDSEAADQIRIRSLLLRRAMGCSVVSGRKVRQAAAVAAAAKAQASAAPVKGKSGKPPPAATAPAPAPAISAGSTATEDRLQPSQKIVWRVLSDEELNRVAANAADTAADLLNTLLRKGAKDDVSDLLASTRRAAVDVSRLVTSQSRTSATPSSSFVPPSQVIAQASKRADIIVLPNLSLTLPSKPSTAGTGSSHASTNLPRPSTFASLPSDLNGSTSKSKGRERKTKLDTRRFDPPPKGWAESTATIVIS